MMIDFRMTNTWKTTLAHRELDRFSEERETLRNSFLNCRKKSELLVQEIAKDLPEYTNHDITHIDALWEYCDIVAGDSITLNPIEAYVLGISFLIHDAGMSLAAYPAGLLELEATSIWKDLYSLYQKDPIWTKNRSEEEIRRVVTAETLRLCHAEKSSEIVTQYWTKKTGEQIYLIDNEKLRASLAESIGNIAKSHWDSIEIVHQTLNKIVGAPTNMPPEWTYDTLKIACVLRACDVAHLDSRRAPYFTRMFRNLPPSSEAHWAFQELLNRPILVGDRISYTSSRSFSQGEESAWWLCYDTLKYVDAELRSTDGLLADTRSDCRLSARGVANVEAPALMEKNVGAAGWVPIDASLRISSLSKVVSVLGGIGLYGDDPFLALRELIQNSCDAVRARRLIEDRPSDWGEVSVILQQLGSNVSVEVRDNGIGMSLDTLTSKLLDFGSSYWDSPLSYKELPTLHAKGYRSTGQFGIGFFASFMLGEKIILRTRRPSSSVEQTIELRFDSGLGSRPSVRFADHGNVLIDPGTMIQIILEDEIKKRVVSNRNFELTFEEKIQQIACACDVDILVINRLTETNTRILANSWMKMNAKDFFVRARSRYFDFEEMNVSDVKTEIKSKVKRARVVRSKSGEVLGFGYLNPSESRFSIGSILEGVVTVGGLKADAINGVAGIFLGTTNSADRNSAYLRGSREDYAEWVEEQVKLIMKENSSGKSIMQLVEWLYVCGFSDENIPFIYRNGPEMSIGEFRNALSSLEEVIIVQDASVHLKETNLAELGEQGSSSKIALEDNVFVVPMGTASLFPYRRGFSESRIWEGDDNDQLRIADMSLFGWLLKIISEEWNIKNPMDSKGFESKEVRIGSYEGKVVRDRAYVVNKRDLQRKNPRLKKSDRKSH